MCHTERRKTKRGMGCSQYIVVLDKGWSPFQQQRATSNEENECRRFSSVSTALVCESSRVVREMTLLGFVYFIGVCFFFISDKYSLICIHICEYKIRQYVNKRSSFSEAAW